ncbi:MAG: hypothetical protein LBJ14_03175, partial [Desulfarculales bacterium]|nr:hypothetical protein [Desulfarculales bacterium]
YALQEIARQTGLLPVLEMCFPEMWPQLLTLAFYMLCQGNVMMYLNDWFDETDIPFTPPMDDLQCSRIFASITHEERMGFFAEWIKTRYEDRL